MYERDSRGISLGKSSKELVYVRGEGRVQREGSRWIFTRKKNVLVSDSWFI